MVSTPITLHLTEPAGFLMRLCVACLPQRDAVIDVDAETCRFLGMPVGFSCSDRDA